MKLRSKRLALLLPLLLAAAIGSVELAKAQPAGLTCGSLSLAMQTTEPATGFTGACLAQYMTYAAQLPVVCYSPAVAGGAEGGAAAGALPDGAPGDAGPGDAGSPASTGGVTYGQGTTACMVPAGNVFRSYFTLANSYDSYQVLMTCYPHGDDGKCHQGFAVSRSCCDYGTNLISLDGQTATGLVNFQ
jgi:hypothetical protein